jgi:AraC-like DNA-binding protein
MKHRFELLAALEEPVTTLHVQIERCWFGDLEEWDFSDLSAPHWRLYWNDRAGAQIQSADGTVAIPPGEFVVIAPDTPFATRLRNPVHHLYIHFTSMANRALKGAVTTFRVDPWRDLLNELLKSMRDGRQGSACMAAYALVHIALSQVQADTASRVFKDARVNASIIHMQKSFGSDVRNSELARQVGMNTTAFIRLFKENTGTTPHAYLARLRIEQACILLQRSEISIGEIAERTGFSDRYHLSHVFARLRGISPAAYRRRKV